MLILKISKDDNIWNVVADFAEKCSWNACARMANIMREDGFSDWERIFVAVENDEIMGFCALVKSKGFQGFETNPLIKWLFVCEQFRGKRLSEKLLGTAEKYASEIGFNEVFLTTWHIGLYEKFGYRKIHEVLVRENYSEAIFKKDIIK